MATEITLPRLGQGMESGVIVRWLKQEGDAVSKGEPLYELDTDKVTQEVEAEVDGVLQQIVVSEGEVEVGATIAVVETNSKPESSDGDSAGEPEEPAVEAEAPAAAQDDDETSPEATTAEEAQSGSARRRAPAEETAAAADTEEEEAPSDTVSQGTDAPAAAPQTAGGPLKASPLARRIARERGIDLAAVSGTGPEGRILAEDVERAPSAGERAAAPDRAAPATVPAGEPELVELTSVRKTIARRLTEAWAAPVFQLGVTADMTETLALRQQLVEHMAEGEAKPTVNDVLVRLAAAALVRHRAVNATFDGERITRHPAAHVGIAVAAPQGLVVPVVRDADRRTVQEIARARADLVGRARDNQLKLPDLEGGTFTISNLGMFGVEQFTAVLNPPQVAILAVGSVKDEPVARDGEVVVAPIAHLVLTCDHRAIDGADGAAYLQTLVSLLERPALAL
jgi:pyruvate dehydrogenase E2 component (dihydrolipoamide acetyltransferase)